MSIRLPLQIVLDVNNSTEVGSGPASTAGGVANEFSLPQDVDGVVVKFTASVLAGGASAVLQTTDDGGTTWYDVGRTSIVSNANNAVSAEWLSVPVAGFGYRGGNVIASTVATGSVVAVTSSILNTIGSAGASTLGSHSMSGMPILSQRGRIFFRYTSTVTSIINERVRVYAQSQSGGK